MRRAPIISCEIMEMIENQGIEWKKKREAETNRTAHFTQGAYEHIQSTIEHDTGVCVSIELIRSILRSHVKRQMSSQLRQKKKVRVQSTREVSEQTAS
jgi:hypothetical protein